MPGVFDDGVALALASKCDQCVREVACFCSAPSSSCLLESWRSGAPSWLMQVCIRAGYDSEELFCGAFVDQAAFEGWMAKFQAKLPDAALTGLAADEWKTHPVAARLRIFWQSLQRSPVVGQQALATRSAETALALLTPNSGAKLSPSDRERMRRQLEKNYSSQTLSQRCAT